MKEQFVSEGSASRVCGLILRRPLGQNRKTTNKAEEQKTSLQSLTGWGQGVKGVAGSEEKRILGEEMRGIRKRDSETERVRLGMKRGERRARTEVDNETRREARVEIRRHADKDVERDRERGGREREKKRKRRRERGREGERNRKGERGRERERNAGVKERMR